VKTGLSVKDAVLVEDGNAHPHVSHVHLPYFDGILKADFTVHEITQDLTASTHERYSKDDYTSGTSLGMALTEVPDMRPERQAVILRFRSCTVGIRRSGLVSSCPKSCATQSSISDHDSSLAIARE
jgi:hypothetical protein